MTKTEWDYSSLAEHYDQRAEYASQAIDVLIAALRLAEGDAVGDIGAGTGKLARPLAQRGMVVSAVEPNDEMRARGIRNTDRLSVSWRDGIGEHTGLADRSMRAVTFGSSFNVVDQQATLRECARIVEPGGGFACLWNHRDLDDPLQMRIEQIIHDAIPGYQYGSRREDPTSALSTSGLFETVHPFSSSFVVTMTRAAALEAWRSHGTLARQAGDAFPRIIDAVAKELKGESIDVPYTTRGWYSRFKA
jgi:ubiquinone/menaquinone biosynthesis C-methylase UbiE